MNLSAFRIATLLAAPMLAFPAAISLTPGGSSGPTNMGPSTTCLYGDCSAIDSLSTGQSASGSPAFTFTINGDSYQLLAPFSAANHDPHGTALEFDPTVIYKGSTPTQQSDIFTVDFWQNYIYTGALNGFDFDEATGAIVSDPGGWFTDQVFYGGKGVGLLGPFFTGESLATGEKQLSGLSGTPLTLEFQYVFDFADGTTSGAFMAAPSTIPEPASGALAIMGVGLLAAGIKRRRGAK